MWHVPQSLAGRSARGSGSAWNSLAETRLNTIETDTSFDFWHPSSGWTADRARGCRPVAPPEDGATGSVLQSFGTRSTARQQLSCLWHVGHDGDGHCERRLPGHSCGYAEGLQRYTRRRVKATAGDQTALISRGFRSRSSQEGRGSDSLDAGTCLSDPFLDQMAGIGIVWRDVGARRRTNCERGGPTSRRNSRQLAARGEETIQGPETEKARSLPVTVSGPARFRVLNQSEATKGNAAPLPNQPGQRRRP